MSLELTSNDSQINFKMRDVSSQKVFEFEDFRLDVLHLLLYKGGEQLPLTPKVIETLLALVERHGEVLSKEQLMNIVWPDSIVEESNLSQNLYLLRKTLGNTNTGVPFIETLRRRGYRFNGQVSLINTAAPEADNDSTPLYVSEIEPSNEIAPPILTARLLNVERHGNVLALADWKKDEGNRAAVPQAEMAMKQPENAARRRFTFYFALAVVVALILSFTALGLRSLSSSASGQTKNELTVTKLTDGQNFDVAAISRDGNYFAYVTNDGGKDRLWLQQTGYAGPVEITEPFEGVVYGITFSPDGRFIYFVINEKGSVQNTLYRVPTLGGVKNRVLADVPAAVSFSPDGTEMVFMRSSAEAKDASLVIAASDGSTQRILKTVAASNAESINGGGEWSPDGRTIAWGLVDIKTIGQGGCSIVGTDVRSGETRPLSAERWDNCFRMAWTQDSKGLVFIATRMNEAFSTRRDQVYYLDLAERQSRRLTTDGSRYQYMSLGVTDKDEVFAVPYNRLSQLWSMDGGGDSRTAVQITSGQTDGRGGIVSLADGRLAYLARNGDGFSIWTVNNDGSNRRQLTTDPPAIEELRASADGRFFVFAVKKDGFNHLYRIDGNGETLQQLTYGESQEVDSTISPDGNWIIYDSKVYKGDFGKTSLWKLPSTGGEPSLFSNADCITPHFSPDGKLISCISPDWKQIMILSVEEGLPVTTFLPRENAILNVGSRWTPDGKAITYIVNQNNACNIMLQPVDGGDPRPLTDFTSGQIYNYSYSSDGSRLFLARGYAVSNAVLIRGFK